MAQAEGSHRFRDTTRLSLIHWKRPAGLDGTVVTAPGTDIAENEECRRAGIPTFPPIRTTGLLANRMEIEPLHGLLDIEIIRAGSGLNLKPWRKTGPVIS